MPRSVAAWFARGVLLAGFAGPALPVCPPVQSENLSPGSVSLVAGDILSVKVLDLDEFGERTVKIDESGFINLPVAGRIRAGGHTPEWLQAEIAARLLVYLKQPAVTVTLVELHEELISVTGAVNSPGIRKWDGNKGLVEAVSESGGFKADAGPFIKLTRLCDEGPIPHASSTLDPTGKFYVAQIEIATLLSGQNPAANIALRPRDIVAVPPAGVVYILGEVGHPGAYDFSSPSISVLNALARAGGSNRNADFSHVRVLRLRPGSTERTEFVMNLNVMLTGKSPEFLLGAQDIFYIPTNKGKVVTTRALEAIVGTGSSIAVFRGSR
jgi:polysaccharide export outer membrane protein